MAAEERPGWGSQLLSWGDTLMFPFIILGGLIVMPLVFGSCLAIVLVLCIPGVWGHFRFVRRMRRGGRLVTWSEIENQLMARKGTLLLIHCIRDQIDAAWWIPEPHGSEFPKRLLPTYRTWLDNRLSRKGLPLFDNLDEIMRQCHEQYLDEERGMAAFLKVPRYAWKRLASDVPEEAVLVTLSSYLLPDLEGVANPGENRNRHEG